MNVDRKEFASPLDALLELKADLLAFERQYGMTSDAFYARFEAGGLGDGRDMMAWAGDYQLYQSLKRELEQKLQLVQAS
jgi:hypothetical protein